MTALSGQNPKRRNTKHRSTEGPTHRKVIIPVTQVWDRISYHTAVLSSHTDISCHCCLVMSYWYIISLLSCHVIPIYHITTVLSCHTDISYHCCLVMSYWYIISLLSCHVILLYHIALIHHMILIYLVLISYTLITIIHHPGITSHHTYIVKPRQLICVTKINTMSRPNGCHWIESFWTCYWV